MIWLHWSGSAGWGTFFLIWSLVVLTMDNVLRPWLITRGPNLPILLIFAGVIGGLLGFGVIGLVTDGDAAIVAPAAVPAPAVSVHPPAA